jgi:hypothetical protein
MNTILNTRNAGELREGLRRRYVVYQPPGRYCGALPAERPEDELKNEAEIAVELNGSA